MYGMVNTCKLLLKVRQREKAKWLLTGLVRQLAESGIAMMLFISSYTAFNPPDYRQNLTHTVGALELGKPVFLLPLGGQALRKDCTILFGQRMLEKANAVL